MLVVMLIATWYAAFHIAVFESADRSILQGFMGLDHHPHVGGLANRIATLCDPKPYVYFCCDPGGGRDRCEGGCGWRWRSSRSCSGRT